MSVDTRVVVSSMYGARTREPMVVLLVGETPVQMSPEKAREIGAWLIQAAESAEQDAFFFTWITDKVGGKEQQAAQMLLDYRAWRAAREQHHEEHV